MPNSGNLVGELGLSLGVAPNSGASDGADWIQPNLAPKFSSFYLGGDGDQGGGQTPITGLVRDLAVGVAVALLAKWLWKYVQ